MIINWLIYIIIWCKLDMSTMLFIGVVMQFDAHKQLCQKEIHLGCKNIYKKKSPQLFTYLLLIVFDLSLYILAYHYGYL